VLLYDGECALCRACARFVHRRDPHGRLEVVPYQQANWLTLELRLACGRALHAVAPNGRLYSGARAVLFAGAVLGHRRLARELARPPWIVALAVGYWLVARNRGRLGKLLGLSPY